MSSIENVNHFLTSTHAKTILTGEHAVLRGSAAIVLPLLNKTFALHYLKSPNSLATKCEGLQSEIVLESFWNTLKEGLKLINKSIDKLTGRFHIENHIPIAAGIGYSAALCVAITKWLIWKKWLPSNDIFEFAKTLENQFHGQSSGLDIVGSMQKTIMLFRIGETPFEIKPNWKPKLCLTFLNTKSKTAECVSKVETLWQHNPENAKLLDQKMRNSVKDAQLSLQLSAEEGLLLLQKAINDAQNCFINWNLMTDEMQTHIHFLQQAGAIASKPTGAGLGGHILSLWEKTPCLKTLNKFSPILINL